MNTLDIKTIRKRLKLTQNDLAEKLGVHYKTIQNWEKGGVIPASKMILLRNLGLAPTTPTDEIELLNAREARDQHVPYLVTPVAQVTYLLPLTARSLEISPLHLLDAGDSYERVPSPVKGADFATFLSDDGLGPEFPDGSLVFFKHIDPKLFIEWGKVHAVSTKNGLIIKRLNPGSTSESLICSCPDPSFEPFEINMRQPGLHFYKAIACTAIK